MLNIAYIYTQGVIGIFTVVQGCTSCKRASQLPFVVIKFLQSKLTPLMTSANGMSVYWPLFRVKNKETFDKQRKSITGKQDKEITSKVVEQHHQVPRSESAYVGRHLTRLKRRIFFFSFFKIERKK